MVDDSILNSIKKSLGFDEDYDAFDTDIVMHINSVFFNLKQIGIGPEEGFFVENKEAKWSDFVEMPKFQAVKTYMYLKVRLLFDPPATSFAIESMDKLAKEYEWRLNVELTPPLPPPVTEDPDY